MDIVTPGKSNKTGQKTPQSAYAWIVLAVTLMAGIAAPLNQFKVPPLMPVLIENMRLDLASSGYLMSIFAITGCLLALPAGIVMRRLGQKVTGLIAMVCLVLGSVLGALASSAQALFLSRFIEGAGMGLIAVVAPALIADWFPPEKRSGPMGVWATWVPLGNIFMFFIAPPLGAALGWRSVWWFGAAFALMALVLFAIFVRPAPAAENAGEGSSTEPDLRQALSNRNAWLISLSFACFNFVLVGVIGTFYPTFLTTVRGFSLASASSIATLSNVVGIITAPLAGLIMDKAGVRKPYMLGATVGVMVWMIFPFSQAPAVIPYLIAGLGLFMVFIPTGVFAAIPDVMKDPRSAGIGMAILMIGQNLGQLLGSLTFGKLVEAAGWASAGLWMIPVLLVGLVALALTRMR